MEKDTTTKTDEGMIEIYKRLRPGEPPTLDSARTLINSLFFDARRYDLANVGRYKYNKKLAIGARIMFKVAAEDIISPLHTITTSTGSEGMDLIIKTERQSAFMVLI